MTGEDRQESDQPFFSLEGSTVLSVPPSSEAKSRSMNDFPVSGSLITTSIGHDPLWLSVEFI